jgi:SAM-dependent methyltransferase
VKTDRHPIVGGLRVTWQTLLAHGDPAFGIWVPEDPDLTLDLLTQDEFDRTDERMPYFATVWPSAEALVAEILAGPRLDDHEVQDLGCGLGACGFAAIHRGARVTFFDWEPRALEIVAASASAQRISANAFRLVLGDWREPPDLGSFDLILGADVLYERRNAPAVASFLAGHLKPGGEAWITDPGRPQAEHFPRLALNEGLHQVESRLLPPPAPNVEITLRRLRRAK